MDTTTRAPARHHLLALVIAGLVVGLTLLRPTPEVGFAARDTAPPLAEQPSLLVSFEGR